MPGWLLSKNTIEAGLWDVQRAHRASAHATPRSLGKVRREVLKMPRILLSRNVFASAAASIFFCGSFVYLYPRLHGGSEAKRRPPLITTSAVIGRTLPRVDFIDSDNKSFSSQRLESEEAIIAVLSSGCPACTQEVGFLKSVLENDRHLKFYGLVTFSDYQDVFAHQDRYPFKLLYDESEGFIKQLEIDRVPIKLFCDHGVIKKVWVGSTGSEEDRISFTNWLASTQLR
jgi:hypothetical protein